MSFDSSKIPEQVTGSIWTIDQIEAGWVSLVARDFDADPIMLPARLMPSDTQEGDFVNLAVKSVPQMSDQAQDQIAKTIAMLTQDDDGDDFSL